MKDGKGTLRHERSHTEEATSSVKDCAMGQGRDSQDAVLGDEDVWNETIQSGELRNGIAPSNRAESEAAWSKAEQSRMVREEPLRKRDERGGKHNRDISSKEVFGNPFLCAQFLRNCIDVPVLKNIRPEDIEDVSERYHPYLGTEFESDSVKKIRILGIGGKEEKQDGEPSFLISLIEHKSLVDYDVSMQLLRYMMCIWTEYRREMEVKRRGSTGQKSFRYPMIIPVVYYEGKTEWTADMRLGDRIRKIPGLGDWIPDFRYEVIRVHDYSERELLERGDEISLIMLINKIQDDADLARFLRIPSEELNRIVRHSPEHVVDVLVSVVESLCFKIAAPAEDRIKCVQKVRAREMGYLFENMDRINVSEMQQKVKEHQCKMEEQQRKIEKERKRADEAEEKLKIAEEKIKQLEELAQNKNALPK